MGDCDRRVVWVPLGHVPRHQDGSYVSIWYFCSQGGDVERSVCRESPWSKQNKHRKHIPVIKKLLIKRKLPPCPSIGTPALSCGLSLVLEAASLEAGADGEAL